MMSHYFTDNTGMPENRQIHEVSFDGSVYPFMTDNGVFAKTGPDQGSMILLEAVRNEKIHGDVLDLGCGYGLIGILVRKMFPDTRMLGTDINPRAVELARINAAACGEAIEYRVSDGFAGISEMLDAILVNPPIRAGKQVIYTLFEDAYTHLKDGGTLYTVIRRKQGAESAVKKLNDIFGNCEILERRKGYWILKNRRLTDGQ